MTGRRRSGRATVGSRDLVGHLAGLDHALLTTLLLRCADGDREAFADFYSLTSPALAALVAAHRLPPAETNEVLVQTYVSIWRRAATFSNSGCSIWQWTLLILIDTLPRRQEASPPSPEPMAPATAAGQPGDPPRHLTLVEKIGGSRPRQTRRRAG